MQYTKKVIEHFRHPRNVGEIKNPDGVATEGSPLCGDMLTVYLKVDPKTHKVKKMKFKSYGCASNIATASVISEKAIGRTIEELEKMDYLTAARELGGLPPVKVHCSVLAVNALKAAIRDYKLKQGLISKEETPLTHDAVMKELAKVINPEIGISIVRLKMVRNVKIGKDGTVAVYISLGNTDEKFAENISEEVEEHVRKIPGVKKVRVAIRK